MKFVQFLLFTLFVFTIYGQDGVGPLTANPDLFGKEKAMQIKVLNNSFDSTFHYKTDTLNLPFFDDFSRSKFQKYDANFVDPSVTEQLFHRILDQSTSLPLPAETKLTDTRTYRSEYNSVTDTAVFIYLDTVRFLFDDLTIYEPNHIQTYAFPPYIIFDTLDGTA